MEKIQNAEYRMKNENARRRDALFEQLHDFSGHITLRGTRAEIEDVHGFFASSSIGFDALIPDIRSPRALGTFEVTNIRFEDATRVVQDPALARVTTRVAGTVKGTFAYSPTEYAVDVTVGALAGEVYNIPWHLHGAQITVRNDSTGRQSPLVLMQQAELDVAGGVVYARGTVRNGEAEMMVYASSFTMRNLAPSLPLLRYAMLNDMSYVVRTGDAGTQWQCTGTVVNTDTDTVKNRVFETIAFDIAQQGTDITALFSDKEKQHSITCAARITDAGLMLDTCSMILNGNHAFSIAGVVPFKRKGTMQLVLTSGLIDIPFWEKIVGKRIGIIDTATCTAVIQGTFQKPYIKAKLAFAKKSDKGTTIGHATVSYLGDLVYVERCVFAGCTLAGAYNLITGDGALNLACTNTPIGTLLMQYKGTRTSPLKDAYITGTARVTRTGNFLDVLCKGVLDRKTGVALHTTIGIRAQGDMHSMIQGAATCTNIRIGNTQFAKLKTQFAYKDKTETLDIAQCTLDTDVAGHIHIRGSAGHLAGKVTVNSSKLADIFMQLAGRAQQYKGLLKSTLVLHGTLSNPVVVSHDTVLRLEKRNEPTTMHVTGALVFKHKQLVFTKGMMSLTRTQPVMFNAVLGFRKGVALQTDWVFDHCVIQNVLKFFNVSASVTGVMNGTMGVRYSNGGIVILPSLSFKHGDVYGVACDGVQGEVGITNKGKTVEFRDCVITEGKGAVILKRGSSVTTDDKGNVGVRCFVRARNWNFFGLFRAIGDVHLEGIVDARDNAFAGTLYLDNLWANKYNFHRDTTQQFRYEHRTIFFIPDDKGNGIRGALELANGDVVFKNVAWYVNGQERFFFNGGIVGEQRRIQFTSRGVHFPAACISGIIDFGMLIDGDCTYTLRAQGSLSHPVIQTNCSLTNGTMSGLAFDTAAAAVRVERDKVILRSVRVEGKKRYVLSAQGVIPVAIARGTEKDVQREKINVHIVSYNSTLAMLASLADETFEKAEGKLGLDITISNTVQHPVVSGSISVDHGAFSLVDGIKGAKQFTAQITINNNIAVFNKCSATIGSGTLDVKGSMELEQLAPKNFLFEIHASSQGVPITLSYLAISQSKIFNPLIPEVPSRAKIRGTILLAGTPEQYKIAGKMGLWDTHFTYPPPHVDGSGSAFGDFLKGADWDLTLETANNVWYESVYVNVEIAGKLSIIGPKDSIVVNGALDLRQGTINYIGSNFQLLAGKFSVRQDEPYIELKAETEVTRSDPRRTESVADDTIIMTIDSAKLSEIRPQFSSKQFPDTPSHVAMNIALGSGVPSAEANTQATEVYLQREFLRLIDSSLTNPILTSLLRKTGLVDVVKIKTGIVKEVAGPTDSKASQTSTQMQDALKGSSFVFGKYINSSLFLSYSLGLPETNAAGTKHTIDARYRFNQNLFLKGQVGMEKDRTDDQKVSIEYQIPFGKKKPAAATIKK